MAHPGLADRLSRGADSASSWRQAASRPLAGETLVRALIARLMIVARN